MVSVGIFEPLCLFGEFTDVFAQFYEFAVVCTVGPEWKYAKNQLEYLVFFIWNLESPLNLPHNDVRM